MKNWEERDYEKQILEKWQQENKKERQNYINLQQDMLVEEKR